MSSAYESFIKTNYKSRSVSPTDALRNYIKDDASYNTINAGFDRKIASEGIGVSFNDLRKGVNVAYDDNNVFNRYKTIYPGDELSNCLSYVFIVKPDLNMTQATIVDPYYYDLALTHPKVFMNLSYLSDYNSNVNHNGSTHFISYLMDRVTMYSLPDFTVKEYSLDQPYTQFRTLYAGNSNETRTGQSFSIEFREDVNFDVIRLFESWVRYIDSVSYGIFQPFKEYQQSRFLKGITEIDYCTSIYMIVTKPDGQEIVYWHKMTGAFPTTVPHSNFSFNEGSTIDRTVSIQFTGGMPEALNPRILVDFNYNAGILIEDEYERAVGVKSVYKNITPVPHARIGYESSRGGSPLVGGPYITTDNRGKYFLNWRDIS